MAPTVQYVSTTDDVDRDALADELLTLYDSYGRWDDREPAAVREALRETDEVVVVRDDEGDPVAAARVLTDYVYYAQVYDVVVHGGRRGEGLGRTLVEAVVDHPRLGDVSPSLLAREGVTGFYEACGFEDPNPVPRPDGEPEALSWLSYRRADGENGGNAGDAA